MPRARLLWSSGKQTIQYIDDPTVDWLPVERDRIVYVFRSLDDSDADDLQVFKEEPPKR
jgi:hypothetical protein